VKRPHPLLFLIVPVGLILLGLADVGWKWTALPGWYWGATALCTALTLVAIRVIEMTKPERPLAQRVWLLGLSWGVPVSAMMASTDLLHGRFEGSNLVVLIVIRVVIMVLASLAYGSIMANLQRSKVV
jgi:hypothetical protein